MSESWGEDEEEDSMSCSGSQATDSEADFGLDQPVAGRKVTFRILKQADLQSNRKAAIENLTNTLCVSAGEAMRILRKYKWDCDRAQESWFADTDAVRAAIGLNHAPQQQQASSTPTAKETCMVCFEEFPVSQMHSAACHHYFCTDCWQGYVSTAIAQGPASLDLRCPTPKCGACVPREVVRAVVNAEDWEKYETYELRSFVEDNRHMCWCVGKGCDAAVEALTDRSADEPLDVLCTQCQTAFCFACKEEAHRPVLCDMVHKWIVKNSAESENVHWILANTKQCPKCHRPIEKNQGCMHMTCSQCKHQFCWLCLGDWKEHGDGTGGYFACNRFKSAAQDEDNRRRESAKQSLERYLHYYERWDAHQKARNKARHDMAHTVRSQINTLSDHTKTPTSQLSFILDAWEQIADCRRVLSWAYTYGYYTYDLNGITPHKRQQKEFFEFLQGDAESALERLHGLTEKQAASLASQATANRVIDSEFQAFRKDLVGLTEVTRQYFDKLVQQLEKGFDGMEAEYAGRSDPNQIAPYADSQE